MPAACAGAGIAAGSAASVAAAMSRRTVRRAGVRTPPNGQPAAQHRAAPRQTLPNSLPADAEFLCDFLRGMLLSIEKYEHFPAGPRHPFQHFPNELLLFAQRQDLIRCGRGIRRFGQVFQRRSKTLGPSRHVPQREPRGTASDRAEPGAKLPGVAQIAQPLPRRDKYLLSDVFAPRPVAAGAVGQSADQTFITGSQSLQKPGGLRPCTGAPNQHRRGKRKSHP